MTWSPELRYEGNPQAPIMVIMDAPSVKAHSAGVVAPSDHRELFGELASRFGRHEFFFLTPSPPIPDEDRKSETRKAAFIAPYREAVMASIERVNPRCVLAMGTIACRQVFGRAVKIKRVRGIPQEVNGRTVLVTYALGFCQRYPENADLLRTDLDTLARLRDAGYDLGEAERLKVDKVYEWREDVSDLLADRPDIMAVDSEGTGLAWADPDVNVLTVQLSWEPGRAVICPIYAPYWRGYRRRMGDRANLKAQLRELLGDPTIRKVGHNMNFDGHHLREAGLPVTGWVDDTMLLAAAVDENMPNKGLDECVRRWVPEMAGYADQFNREFDKTRMIDVPFDKMLTYGCGDADSTLRLRNELWEILSRDERHATAYTRCSIPALLAFGDPVERLGLGIDVDALDRFRDELSESTAEQYRWLIDAVPTQVKERHERKGLEFSRHDFVRDILFSPVEDGGLGIVPTLFTKSTADLAPDKQIPSTAAKTHLSRFVDDHEFVAKLIAYQKIQKMRSTYVGRPASDEGPATGFYQHIYNGNRIHPSYNLHRARTGRSASENPNGQNIPKHGPLAAAYRKVFVPTDGYGFIECDLSQIELRIAAWMAREEAMIAVFNSGGDIHATTAQGTMGFTDEQWAALSPADRREFRQAAKAINFGLIYGMQAPGLQTYSKTEYGVDMTLAQATTSRRRYFEKYPRLLPWHREVIAFVHKYGYVRAPHGPVRHLPSINSEALFVVSETERQAINSPVQRTASDMGQTAMIRLRRDADLDLIRPVGFIHDALVAEARLEILEEAAANMRWYMETPPMVKWFGPRAECPVPILADIKLSRTNLGEMEEVDIAAVRPSWAGED